MGWNYRRWILEELAAAITPDWDDQEARFPSSLSSSTMPDHVRKTQLELAENELRYTLRKIESNFSNFSAWHQRSKLLPCIWDAKRLDQKQRMMERNKGACTDCLTVEFELLQQAMYTDPSDQSIWIYHRWLVSLSMSTRRLTKDADRHTLEQQIQWIEELAELEPDSKCTFCYTKMTRVHAIAGSLQTARIDRVCRPIGCSCQGDPC